MQIKQNTSREIQNDKQNEQIHSGNTIQQMGIGNYQSEHLKSGIHNGN